jgi:predicted Zn-dependent protease
VKGVIIAVGLFLSQIGFALLSPFANINEQREIEIGRTYFTIIKNSGNLSTNQALLNRTNRIMSQLVLAMPTKQFTFETAVVKDASLNAGCLPGGFLIINEGLLLELKDDNLVAMVLAHEIGHAMRKHFLRMHNQWQSTLLIDQLIQLVGGK